ncbi:MAG TPA: NUDIX domain-containing protein [Patescibacteria group bacterium]|nr:NUDIX domain-containing protein [Patescibacteria group bacterium]
MAKKKLEAKVTKITPEYKGFLTLNKYEIEKDRHEGGKQNITWMIMERGHAVGILAYDPKSDEVVLVNEMRPGILAAGGYPYTDTLPAGGIGKGETAVEAAEREMVEETGLTLKGARVIHDKAYVSAGGTSESIAIVFGLVDTSQAGGIHGLAEEGENIKTTVLKSDEFMAQIRSGEINDLKTIVAGYWLMENKLQLQLDYKNSIKGDFAKEAGRDSAPATEAPKTKGPKPPAL